MSSTPAARSSIAEGVGTGLLVTVVVGSGIMATRLTADVGLQLLLNALATVAGLAVLIWALAPVSGAHLNPAVTLVALARRELSWSVAGLYVVAQMLGAVLGTIVAHVMYDLPPLTVSTHERSGLGQWVGEVVATGGLVALVGVLARRRLGQVAPVVIPAWIGAAYVFTSSTSFANPAVTLGRSVTDTFSGISPSSVPAFVGAQLLGAAIGAVTVSILGAERVLRGEAVSSDGGGGQATDRAD